MVGGGVLGSGACGLGGLELWGVGWDFGAGGLGALGLEPCGPKSEARGR